MKAATTKTPNTAPPTSRERVEAATREAHIRALIVELNNWLRYPEDISQKRAVLRLLTKYERGAGVLFPVSPYPAICRHGLNPLPSGEMREALQLLHKLDNKAPKGLPWE